MPYNHVHFDQTWLSNMKLLLIKTMLSICNFICYLQTDKLVSIVLEATSTYKLII